MPRIKYRIHADDYAVSKHAAEQVIELIKAGIITSVSYMVNMPDSEICLQMLKPYREQIHISLHLNILEGYCCANQSEIPHLVYPNGTFRMNWGTLLWKMFLPTYRCELKKEIKCQIERYYELIGENINTPTPIRIDSHQHFHMIPFVFSCLCEVIEECQYPVEYIRIAREPVWPFVCCVSQYPTYRLVNCLKNMVCNLFSIGNGRLLKNRAIKTCTFLGLIYSDHMNACYIYKILERMNHKTDEVEITFHPGRLLESEETEAYNHAGFLKWHKSENREFEYKECGKLNEMLLNGGNRYERY